MPDRNEAKHALDKVLRKSRIHFYKPIQIAEILYRDRKFGDIDLLKLDDYRTKSRHWRDDISVQLLGTTCSSSVKYQDDVFNATAVPPDLLNELGKENRRTNGGVEAYIYSSFINKHEQLSAALEYCINSDKDNFDIKHLIDSFWNESGLKRSLDKVYEIIVYALFSTLIDVLDLQVEISISDSKLDILSEFSEFAEMVMCLDLSHPTHIQDAKVYRVGVTNAADRGLDMYSNWGPVIQVKHLSLSITLAQSIVDDVNSDKVIIVCKDAERDVILSLLNQIGWHSHI